MRKASNCLLAMAVAIVPSLFVLGPAMAQSGGTWTTKAPMPTARYGQAAGVINGTLYIAGGCCMHNAFPIPRFQVHEAYDPATDTWATKALLPVAVYGAGVGAINGKLYVAGGQPAADAGTPHVTNLQVYDVATNAWTMGAPLPFGLSLPASGVINGKLYLAGGGDVSSLENRVLIYDPAANGWTSGSNMPTPRHFVAGGVVNGVLYAIGGDSPGGAVLNTVEAYDPVTDTWTSKSPMPTPRSGHVVQAINGILYAIGGFNGGVALNTTEAYDAAADSWTTKAAMPTARGAPAAGVVNNVLYVAGGLINGINQDVMEAFTLIVTVVIDIKPGSDPNSLNLGSAGVVPVAILSNATFDATQVDPESVTLAGASVRLIGRGNKYACGKQDANGDGLIDLVCHVETAQFMIEPGATTAVLTGKTFSGQEIRGEDAINIVP